jgi:flagellar hook-associated protein 1 FlgK
VRTAAAADAADGAKLVRESLEAQEQAVSGVSIDEESIDLLLFQRQFQAAARFISTIDETLQTLLSIA